MDKVGYPRGLIRYATQNEIDGKPSQVVRPRIIVYGLLLLALLCGWAWSVTHRSELIAEVLRDRNALYRETAQGVQNDYTLKLINKTQQPHTYRISLKAPDGLALAQGTQTTVPAAAEQVLSLPLTVTATDKVAGKREIEFIVETEDGKTRREVDTSFFGPAP
jgi:polyferredoxin